MPKYYGMNFSWFFAWIILEIWGLGLVFSLRPWGELVGRVKIFHFSRKFHLKM
jgi:hypothetical protein